MRFAVVGGDKRAVLLCSLLARDGHRVYTYALDDAGLPAEIPKSGCLQGCLYGADCVILPVPAEKGGTVNAPLAAEPLETERLADALWQGQLVCGGGLSRSFRAMALAAGIPAEDLLERPDFAEGNAALTAEGALDILLRESEKSILHSRALVMGWGRLGKSLCRRLSALGAEVTVAARRGDSRAEARANGHAAVDFREAESGFGGYDYVLNTVPARVISQRALCTAEDVLVVELASAPGGFDRALAENLGLRLIQAPGLPGKCAPMAAAELIRDEVYALLNEREDGK